MWTRFSRARWLPAFAAVQAVALAGMLALARFGPGAAGAPAQDSAPPPPLQRPVATELDGLRVDAGIGNLFAGRLLVTQLLDRYERSGDTDDLFEAVQWMDRAWSTGEYQQSGLATRVFLRHCGHKVLRWHWLCTAGE